MFRLNSLKENLYLAT